LTEGAYFELNDVGSRVWQLLQQPCSVRSIRDTLLEEYEVSNEQCEQDVLKLVNELIERGLAVVVDGADS
jgi:glycerol dehydrogenase-like iron-containing ADH family enzyme